RPPVTGRCRTGDACHEPERAVMTGRSTPGNRPVRALAWVTAAALGASLLWGYWTTLAQLARRWSQDPQYSHGYVVPVLARLVLGRRGRRPAPARPSWWGLALLVAGRRGPADGRLLLPRLAGRRLPAADAGGVVPPGERAAGPALGLAGGRF